MPVDLLFCGSSAVEPAVATDCKVLRAPNDEALGRTFVTAQAED